MMVGLSVVLEGYKDITPATTARKKIPFHRIINKSRMIKSPPPPSFDSFTKGNPFSFSSSSSSGNSSCRNGGGFLECCFLCKQKLLPGRDIYMYKGDRAFCTEECRCRQIFMDEEEIFMSNKPPYDNHCSAAAKSAPGSSASSSARRKGTNKNQANGFAC